MGLINGNDNNNPSNTFSPYIENYNDRPPENSLVSSTDDESDSQSLPSQPASRPRRHRTKQYISVSQENLSRFGSRRGIRHARRVDNLKYLLNLEEKDEDIVMNDSVSSFEPSSSLFEVLFENPEKMEAWSSFVESSEEDQMKILNYRGLHVIREDDEWDTEMTTAEDTWVMILDDRSDHPAYSPVQCYNRVDRNLRALLKRRQLPMGMLANLERELVTFFHDCPTSVFISHISSSYERMLLHALCQYLDLHSQSFDENGSRRTQVENRNQLFRPPSLLLTEYLQQHQQSL
ncbi:R3H domain-containing protein 4-like [Physella acuta]|uniref:R3H domain-containing protein 4-like n=1 Tax=Physella acuta TaxID=109671 RepID=UPI0027DAC596|nr:R3H domain-containing protein 4-like [Physella acuta]